MEKETPKQNTLTIEQKAHLIACKEKQKQQHKEWFQANKEKMREYQKKYYHEKLKTDEEYKEKMKSTKRKEITHKYYLKRKEKIELALKDDKINQPLIILDKAILV